MLLEKSYYDIADDVKESWEHNNGVNREEFRKKELFMLFFPLYVAKSSRDCIQTAETDTKKNWPKFDRKVYYY